MVVNKKEKEKVKTQARKAKEMKARKMTKKEMMTMPKEAPEVANKTNQ
jgi:hypothetical protein